MITETPITPAYRCRQLATLMDNVQDQLEKAFGRMHLQGGIREEASGRMHLEDGISEEASGSKQLGGGRND